MSTLAAFADACPVCFPDGGEPVLPSAEPALEGGSLKASYWCGSGHTWSCWWDPEAAGWPLVRQETAA